MSLGLRIAACILFGIAAFAGIAGVGVPAVGLVPLGLLLWCVSTMVS
jgi:hypothetical protein